ncbi:choice-of-anchor A family protein [Rhizophagus clarus]|uniref:Choice-of-anchor A family protein n=1 Tax=Rhizophagus clarus TaxID=94130 RepID=A0A8H3M3R0_9GLOM|nr:choice-of-anchor A family protein [Rhizophagus clarus]
MFSNSDSAVIINDTTTILNILGEFEKRTYASIVALLSPPGIVPVPVEGIDGAEGVPGAPPPGEDAPGGEVPPPGEDAPGGEVPPPGDDAPPPGGEVPPPGDDAPPPGGEVPPPGDDAPPPGGEVPPPGGDAPPPPGGDVPPPGGDAPPGGDVPPPEEDVSPPGGDAEGDPELDGAFPPFVGVTVWDGFSVEVFVPLPLSTLPSVPLFFFEPSFVAQTDTKFNKIIMINKVP